MYTNAILKNNGKKGKTMARIGIIEDDKMLNQALKIALQKGGFAASCAYDCKEAVQMLNNGDNLDLLLIDVTLPDGNGIRLYEEILRNGIKELPAIFLTARDEEREMLEAFDAGADDYVVKPFQMKVLLKRIEAVLRRTDKDKVFIFDDLEVWPEKRRVFRGGEEIMLTAREYNLLEFFAKNQGQVLTREMILESVWGIDGQFVEENTVSVTIGRLRRKIGDQKVQKALIKNVFGLGYRFGE